MEYSHPCYSVPQVISVLTELSLPHNTLVLLDLTPMLLIYNAKKTVLYALWVTTVWVVNLHPRHRAPGDITALREPRQQPSFLAMQAHTTTKLGTLEYRTVLIALLVTTVSRALQSLHPAPQGHFQSLLEQ